MRGTYRKQHRPLTAGRALRYGRIAAAVTMLAAVTVLLTTSATWIARSLDWTARIQIVPLAMCGAVAALVAQALVALVFGRIYCSVACPLGVAQDVAARLPGTGRRAAKHAWRYSAPRNPVRIGILGLCVAAGICAVPAVVSLLDPYSTYARFASQWLRPAVQWAGGDEAATASWLAAAISLAVMAAVLATAWRGGRTVCNTVCPVGTLLGIFSRYSMLHIDIDTDLCVNCRKCERACKGHCINLDDHVVDGSRCVVCFDCTAVCPEGAISYTTRRKRLALPMMQRVETGATASTSGPVRISRRKFMATGLLLASAPLISRAESVLDAADAAATDTDTTPIAPPGRRTLNDFHRKCTACGLCVSHCPGKVLRPSAGEYGWRNTLQPLVDYNRGRCLYDCTLCTELCPTGALEPLTVEEKHIFIIGHAHVDPQLCVGCGACAASCPRTVIKMVSSNGRQRPLATVAPHGCIGCGACQDVCPIGPEKAIRVNGIKP